MCEGHSFFKIEWGFVSQAVWGLLAHGSRTHPGRACRAGDEAPGQESRRGPQVSRGRSEAGSGISAAAISITPYFLRSSFPDGLFSKHLLGTYEWSKNHTRSTFSGIYVLVEKIENKHIGYF